MQKKYPSYVGVRRDPAWESFTGFFDDMGSTWFPGACLARYGDEGDYIPGNCRWVTKAENARDKIKHFTSEGLPGIDVARENEVPISTFGVRIARGWFVDDAVRKTKR